MGVVSFLLVSLCFIDTKYLTKYDRIYSSICSLQPRLQTGIKCKLSVFNLARFQASFSRFSRSVGHCLLLVGGEILRRTKSVDRYSNPTLCLEQKNRELIGIFAQFETLRK